MIVVDTNVIAYLYLASEYSESTEQLLTRDPSWSAPLLWRSEFRNVLSSYLRKKILVLPEAQNIFEAAAGLLRGNEYEVVASQVLKLAADSGCSAYDCEFVSLARDLGIPLITMDNKLRQCFPGTALSLADYLE